MPFYRFFYHLTKDVIPRAYFSKMLKGEWYGPRSIFPLNTSLNLSKQPASLPSLVSLLIITSI